MTFSGRTSRKALDQRQTSPAKLGAVMGVQYQEKLAGDLLLGLNFVKLEILSTSFIDFLYDKLGEFRSRALGFRVKLTNLVKRIEGNLC